MQLFKKVTFCTNLKLKKTNTNDKNKNTRTKQTIMNIFSNQIFISQITKLKTPETSKNVQNVVKKKNNTDILLQNS